MSTTWTCLIILCCSLFLRGVITKNFIQDGPLPHCVLPSFAWLWTTICPVSGISTEDQQNCPCQVPIKPHVICWCGVGPMRSESIKIKNINKTEQQIQDNFAAVILELLSKVLTSCLSGCRSVCKMLRLTKKLY